MSAIATSLVPFSPHAFMKQISNTFFSEALFDVMPDVVFFVKDRAGRYVVVNQALVSRCGLQSKADLIGRRAIDVFTASSAAGYDEQDQYVLNSGKELQQQLELRMYPNGEAIWCVTHKIPLRDDAFKVIGLAGISRDLSMPNQRHSAYHSISGAVRHLHSYYMQDLQMDILTQISQLSMAEVEANFRQIFAITPRQMLTKLRIDAAINLLADASKPLSEVAAEVGYHDVNAFSSIFQTTLGLSPADYRHTIVKKPERRRH